MPPAIRVENLGKQYLLGELERYSTFRETIARAVTRPASRLFHRLHRYAISAPGQPSTTNHQPSTTSHSPESIWALRDVSFEVKHGEVLGIIGPNGAGKSTLLKILSRITEPTTGYAEIRGRVGSLLEVGTGFHPELTGRENVYLNGSILGMSKAEIRRKFDDIVSFAGVEKFIDTPVKRYSSGMQVRLAFAVAAHLDPEILIVDEVLAVGDAEFQKRCLGKMDEVSRSGRTILFVSHNMAAVEALCISAILLQKGLIHYAGTVSGALARYLTPANISKTHGRGVWTDNTGSGLITQIRLLNEAGVPTDTIAAGKPMTFEISLRSSKRVGPLTIRIVLTTDMGVRVCNFNSRIETNQLFDVVGQRRFRCTVPEQRLGIGGYLLAVHVLSGSTQVCGVDPAMHFHVGASDLFGTGRLPSQGKAVYLPRTVWTVLDR